MEAMATVETRIKLYPGWLAAAVMIGAATMDLIDLTIVNVALPTIRTDLGARGTQLEWVISAYMLAFAATLIVWGASVTCSAASASSSPESRPSGSRAWRPGCRRHPTS